jgi:hypothetical protein
MPLKEEKMQEILELQELGKKESEALHPEPDYFDQEMMRFHKFLIENDETLMPPEIKDKMWVFMDRELAVSNLDKDDIKRGLIWFDIAKIDWMMSQPDYKLSFETMRNLDQMRFRALVRMKRSFGGMERERALIATQIKEIRTPERKGGGFWSRMFGGVKD